MEKQSNLLSKTRLQRKSCISFALTVNSVLTNKQNYSKDCPSEGTKRKVTAPQKIPAEKKEGHAFVRKIKGGKHVKSRHFPHA